MFLLSIDLSNLVFKCLINEVIALGEVLPDGAEHKPPFRELLNNLIEHNFEYLRGGIDLGEWCLLLFVHELQRIVVFALQNLLTEFDLLQEVDLETEVL